MKADSCKLPSETWFLKICVVHACVLLWRSQFAWETQLEIYEFKWCRVSWISVFWWCLHKIYKDLCFLAVINPFVLQQPEAFLSSEDSNFTKWVCAKEALSHNNVSDVSVGPETQDLFMIYESVSIVLHFFYLQTIRKLWRM